MVLLTQLSACAFAPWEKQTVKGDTPEAKVIAAQKNLDLLAGQICCLVVPILPLFDYFFGKAAWQFSHGAQVVKSASTANRRVRGLGGC